MAAPRADRRAFAKPIAGLLERIEDARRARPDADADHDAYVDVEEQRFDLRSLL